MNEILEITRDLRKKGFRLTPQRLAILEVFIEARAHLAPKTVYDRVRKIAPGVTEPTVYRTLSFLTREGILLCTHAGNGSLKYELADDLHHHLMCRKCSRSIEIAHDALNALSRQIQQQIGFLLDEHHITLFGYCAECQ